MSTDHSLQLLLNLIRQEQQPSIWIADEHAASLDNLSSNPQVSVVSNRFDVAETLKKQGWNSQFSDLDFRHFADKSIANIYFRLAKEKPLVNHLFNQAARLLQVGGQLVITGNKQQGIKNYAKNAARCLAGKASIKKYGSEYIAIIHRGADDSSPIDDKNYTELRIAQHYQAIDILSKPGQFGWDKLDQGSLLLADHFKSQPFTVPSTILDLGCGYGFLSLAAHLTWPRAIITATDNNAAALQSCTMNFQQQCINGKVIADNCASNIQEKYDLILCNPPFHQGFSVEQPLTQRFVTSAKRLSHKQSIILFVVNAFIPLEKIAQRAFKQIDTLENNGQFKIIQLNN